ncbi:serine hydroxymethyltransferase [Candidatus Dependentiae bacterium Noda2021]|nr:serine hydroxymethyltransferase [Candidatus Dependentiae bacterium Noda2021]
MNSLKMHDPILFSLLEKEAARQEGELNLIASENYTWPEVLQANASLLTNKYAEGYPGKRYYGGCTFVDEVETIAIERAKELFAAEHANVQPHAGSQANMAVYFAALQPGDTIMGLSLSHGGHLTHGHSVNFSGTQYKSISYGVDKETECIDYDNLERMVEEHKPRLLVAGASAYSRTLDFKRLGHIAKAHGTLFMADIAHIAGLVAAKLHPNPTEYADFVTSTTHKTLRGPRGGLILSKNEYAEKIDRAIMPGTQGGPFMHTIAAKAVAFAIALTPEFKAYQKRILENAQALVTELKNRHYRIVADGTDNHLFIVDLSSKGITGRAAEAALEKAGIAVSRSCIPHDTQKPWITSGIRIGTPAITARGMNVPEMATVAEWIDQALLNAEDDKKLRAIKQEVEHFCALFPIYTQPHHMSAQTVLDKQLVP